MSDRLIWYIHGAFSSPRSFEWIKTVLPEHRAINVEYSCAGDLNGVINEIERKALESEPFDIVGHSLGGVIGVILAQRCPQVRRVVTMASPFGGSRMAAFLQFLTPGTFMHHMQPLSPIMVEARQTPPRPTLSLVTTGGSIPAFLEPNDGVVTLNSQRALIGASYVDVAVNHFEVLLDAQTPRLIFEFLWSDSEFGLPKP